MKAVVTVLGKDRTGIIAEVSHLLYLKGVNVLDISQTIMEGCFTMMMVVDLHDDYARGAWAGFAVRSGAQ